MEATDMRAIPASGDRTAPSSSRQGSRVRHPSRLPTRTTTTSSDTNENRREPAQSKMRFEPVIIDESERQRMRADARLVPLAGIEPALLAELDFESSASTSSATGAFAGLPERPASRSRRNIAGRLPGSTRAYVIGSQLDSAARAG